MSREGDEVVHLGRENYSVPIHRAGLRDSRLSWGARGLFAFLWDLPSDWKPCAAHLKTMGPDGRDAVRARLAELETVGALRFERILGKGGRFDGTRWIIVSPAVWARESPLRAQSGAAAKDS